jgi:hypothetical protein
MVLRPGLLSTMVMVVVLRSTKVSAVRPLDVTKLEAGTLQPGLSLNFGNVTSYDPASNVDSLRGFLENSTGDPYNVAQLLIANVFPASMIDRIPTNVYLMPSPSLEEFQIGPCLGSLVALCLHYGMSDCPRHTKEA